MKCLKHFYLGYYQTIKLSSTKSPCYERFVNTQKKVFILMNCFLRFIINKTARRTDIYYIDSTFLEVCKNQRIYRHKTFDGIATRGFSSCGWFYGFKLYLITNHIGNIISFVITKGNISDSKMIAKLSKNLTSLLFGDKGYLSAKTSKDFLKQGLHLITKLRSNMKPKLISKTNKFLLHKRGIVETLTAYMLNPNKPSICLRKIEST